MNLEKNDLSEWQGRNICLGIYPKQISSFPDDTDITMRYVDIQLPTSVHGAAMTYFNEVRRTSGITTMKDFEYFWLQFEKSITSVIPKDYIEYLVIGNFDDARVSMLERIVNRGSFTYREKKYNNAFRNVTKAERIEGSLTYRSNYSASTDIPRIEETILDTTYSNKTIMDKQEFSATEMLAKQEEASRRLRGLQELFMNDTIKKAIYDQFEKDAPELEPKKDDKRDIDF